MGTSRYCENLPLRQRKRVTRVTSTETTETFMLVFIFIASCSDPGVPKHGQRIGSNFGHGNKVTFVCPPQYSLEGSHSMTCHDGKWTSTLPVCKGILR